MFHNGANIADRVKAVIADFGLSDKVFSITLDNASANTTAIFSLLTKGFFNEAVIAQL